MYEVGQVVIERIRVNGEWHDARVVVKVTTRDYVETSSGGLFNRWGIRGCVDAGNYASIRDLDHATLAKDQSTRARDRGPLKP